MNVDEKQISRPDGYITVTCSCGVIAVFELGPPHFQFQRFFRFINQHIPVVGKREPTELNVVAWVGGSCFTYKITPVETFDLFIHQDF